MGRGHCGGTQTWTTIKFRNYVNWTGTQFFVIFLQQIKCPRHSTLGRVMAVSQTIPGRSSLFPPGVPSSSPTLFLTSQCSGDSLTTHVQSSPSAVQPYYCIIK